MTLIRRFRNPTFNKPHSQARQEARMKYKFRLVRDHSSDPRPEEIDKSFGAFARFPQRDGDEWLPHERRETHSSSSMEERSLANEAPTVLAALRGFGFHPGGIRRAVTLVPGQGVILDREPHNAFQSNAIKVLRGTAVEGFVGYIDRGSADMIAPFMDQGIIYTATVITPAITKRKPGWIGIKADSITVRCVPMPPLTTKAKRRVSVDA